MEPDKLKRYISRAVASADSLFERLVFLGSLRNAYTGRYLHEGWVGLASADEIHSVMRDFHESLFDSVLRLSVIDLGKELRIHFRMLGEPERETALLWLQTEPFRDLVPQACGSLLRQIFLSQVRTALAVLCCAPEWQELAGPVALQPQQLGQSPQLRWLN